MIKYLSGFHGCSSHINRKAHILGYVNGIRSLGPSPRRCLIGGMVRAIRGPIPPTTKLQKIAGFAVDAHRMYLTGWRQKRGVVASPAVVNGVTIFGRICPLDRNRLGVRIETGVGLLPSLFDRLYRGEMRRQCVNKAQAVDVARVVEVRAGCASEPRRFVSPRKLQRKL